MIIVNNCCFNDLPVTTFGDGEDHTIIDYGTTRRQQGDFFANISMHVCWVIWWNNRHAVVGRCSFPQPRFSPWCCHLVNIDKMQWCCRQKQELRHSGAGMILILTFWTHSQSQTWVPYSHHVHQIWWLLILSFFIPCFRKHSYFACVWPVLLYLCSTSLLIAACSLAVLYF